MFSMIQTKLFEFTVMKIKLKQQMGGARSMFGKIRKGETYLTEENFPIL